MDCQTQIQLRTLQLEEARLEFERQRHEDIMNLEYARLRHLMPEQATQEAPSIPANRPIKAAEVSEMSLSELLNSFLSSNRHSF